MVSEKWLQELPKAELHCHLDGSLSPEVLKELAAAGQLTLPGSDQEFRKLIQVQEDCESLTEYLQAFELPLACLKNGKAFFLAAYDVVKHAAREHVRYMEVRFAPVLSESNVLSMEEIIESVIEGLAAGQRDFGIYAAVILCGMRHLPAEENIRMAKIGSRFYGKGVCAFDLAGDENAFPPMLHKKYFEFVRSLGIPLTIHAGECGSSENIIDALELGARRIGHGIAMKDNSQARKRCLDNGIGIEMCPSSNLQTKAVAGMPEYPFMEFYQEGLKISIHTDNRTVTNTTLTREFQVLDDAYKLNQEDFKQLTKNAVETAFAPDQVKTMLLKEIEQY